MEREILYRAKAINRDKGYHRTTYKNGDWVYGLVTRLYNEYFENLPAEMTNTAGVSGIEVDYKTVGQYTGLTDKNDRKIFEGDVVRLDNRSPKGSWTAVVEFGNPNGTYSWGYQLKRIDGDEGFNPDILLWIEMEETGATCEVIGNIHDNPEILKGED